MKLEDFESVLKEQFKTSEEILVIKAKEYATSDRLHNFNIAAALKGETPMQALAGMMAKHTVSIYDMCMSHKEYPAEMWNEKITDHINYLILLKAIVTEEQKMSANPEQFDIPVK